MTDRIEVVTGEIQLVGTTDGEPFVLIRDAAGDALLAKGTAAPTGAGYAAGGLFINSAATGANRLLVNGGDASSASFAEVAAAPPPVSCAYPLDDDGTAAALFGMGPAPATAPDYQTVTYTYTDAQPNALALALPAVASFPAQTIAVSTGEIIAVEAVINSTPTQFEGIGIYAQVLHNGTPIGQGFIKIGDVDGSTPTVERQGGSAARTGATAGFRIGMEFNGTTGAFTYRSTDGLAGTSTVVGFASGDGVLFSIGIDDGPDSPPNLGQTCEIELITAAADMQLSYTAGTTDVCGNEV